MRAEAQRGGHQRQSDNKIPDASPTNFPYYGKHPPEMLSTAECADIRLVIPVVRIYYLDLSSHQLQGALHAAFIAEKHHAERLFKGLHVELFMKWFGSWEPEHRFAVLVHLVASSQTRPDLWL